MQESAAFYSSPRHEGPKRADVSHISSEALQLQSLSVARVCCMYAAHAIARAGGPCCKAFASQSSGVI